MGDVSENYESSAYEQPANATDWVRLIKEAAPSARALYLDDLHRWAQPTVRRISAGILNEMRLDRNTWGDDIESCTAEAMFLLVTEVVEGKMDPSELGSFTALLSFRARSKTREFLDSSAGLNQASGQQGLKRRVKELRWTVNHLTQVHGRMPTAEEVVAATNERMKAKRKDFRRQGMECTLDDYRQMEMGSTASLDYAPETSIADPNDSPTNLHAAERLDLIKMTIDRCYDHSETLGRVAEIWFDPATQDAYDSHPSSADIAPLVGLAEQTTRTKIALVKEYARVVLKDYYGIEGIG